MTPLLAHARQLAISGARPGQRLTPGMVPSGTSPSGKSLAAIWIIIEAMKYAENRAIQNDLATAESQSDNYGDLINRMVMDAAENNIIDSEFQTPGRLGDIANYVLQGEFEGDYDDETKTKMEETAMKIIRDNGVLVRDNN